MAFITLRHSVITAWLWNFQHSLQLSRRRISTQQSRMLAKAVAAQFPNKPIKYAAVTHFHYDHIGGVRAMAALGATILVAKDTSPH
jgi:glyoxylase-like metal-dependent hydrolase (beta-lactamase superfamily II)